MNISILTIILVSYFFIIFYLGFKGFRNTKNQADYLLGGRKIHPLLLALSYGAAFISTSAIVGFGGFAAQLGLSLFWLVFLTIFVGIFLAFIVYGKRTRKIGYILQAHTFPELLGRRFNSSFLQTFGGVFIFLFMPIYAAAVLIGGARILEETFVINYDIALMVYAIFVTFYVLMGGIKGIMYIDALQGGIMFFGTLFLVFYSMWLVGGIQPGFESLNELQFLIPQELAASGHQGWTSMPRTGSDLWWLIMSTLVLGVGIGVLAQPQLIVRFMMVKSKRELYRAVMSGSIFVLVLVGGSFYVGAISNVFFFNHPEVATIGMVHEPNIDRIIPLYINLSMPSWFIYIFMLTILAAAMSTLSSQFHAIGTGIGRDVFQKGLKLTHDGNTILITRIGIFIALLATIILSYRLPMGIIARATAMFFGLCCATFLPAYTAALFWRRVTRKGVIFSVICGFSFMAFLYLFVYIRTSEAFVLSSLIFDKSSILGKPWNIIDPLLLSLPVSTIAVIIGSLLSKDDTPDITKILFS